MGRTLPWKKAASSSPRHSGRGTPTRRATSPSSSSGRPRLPAPTRQPPAVDCRTDRAVPGTDPACSPPSSSPPPEQPVPESVMIPGLQHDDRWRMVEDEFVATAHRFTAHLHAAEYHRLRDVAKKQKNGGPRFSVQPITSSMTDDVRRRHLSKHLAISQHNGVKRAFSRVKDADADEDDLDETPWAGTHLHDLMETPKNKPIAMTTTASVVVGTRAAALSRSQEGCRRKQTQTARSIAENHPPQARQPQMSSAADAPALRTEKENFRSITQLGSLTRRGGTTVDESGLHGAAKFSSASPVYRPSKQARNAVSSTSTSKENDDDSDCSVENEFQRLRRERRKQPRVSRSKSATPDASSQAILPNQNKEGGHRTITKALSIPSI